MRLKGQEIRGPCGRVMSRGSWLLFCSPLPLLKLSQCPIFSLESFDHSIIPADNIDKLFHVPGYEDIADAPVYKWYMV